MQPLGFWILEKEMTDQEMLLFFLIFATGLYATWRVAYNRGMEDGHEIGYGDACYDVAHGNITVTLTPPNEDNK